MTIMLEISEIKGVRISVVSLYPLLLSTFRKERNIFSFARSINNSYSLGRLTSSPLYVLQYRERNSGLDISSPKHSRGENGMSNSFKNDRIALMLLSLKPLCCILSKSGIFSGIRSDSYSVLYVRTSLTIEVCLTLSMIAGKPDFQSLKLYVSLIASTSIGMMQFSFLPITSRISTKSSKLQSNCKFS